MEQLRETEQRKKRENLIKSRLFELLQEEQRMAQWSTREIQMRWVGILRGEKLQELRNEIEILAQTHDKTLDRKNAVIQMLAADLDEAEEQYRLALRTHLNNVDALIELQNQRTAALEDEFERDLYDLKREFDHEKVYIQRKHGEQKEELVLIMKAMQSEAEETENEMQTEFSQQRDETRDKNNEEYNVLKQTLESDILDLHRTIAHEHDKYMTTAEEKMKQYLDKTKKDAETAERISSQMRKIQRLQESIANWKANLVNNMKECEERNKSMKEEKDAMAAHFKRLKAKMQRWRKAQEDRLSELVRTSRDTKKNLITTTKKAERILRLSEQCKLLETERERVLNFENDVPVEEIKKQLEARVESGALPAEAMTLLRQDGLAEEWELLENFWKKYNKVLLDNAAIHQEKFHLQNENSKLRALLKQYLDGISVNDDVMNQRKNNLLMTQRMATQPRPATQKAVVMVAAGGAGPAPTRA
jgi:hypothetical protein